MSSRKLKVGLVWLGLKEGRSGLDVYARNLAKNLSLNSQVSLHIWVRLEDAEREHFNDMECTIHSMECRGALQEILWIHKHLNSELKYQKIDIVHLPCHRRMPFISFDIPVITTVHDILPLEGKRSYGFFHTLYHYFLLHGALKNAQAIIVPSHATKDALVKHCSRLYPKIYFISHGVDIKLFHPIELQQAKELIAQKYQIHTPYFLYISRIEHPQKNHVRLIEAFNAYRNANPNSQMALVFCGAIWPGSDPVIRAIHSSFYSSSIFHLEDIPSEDLKYLYSAAKGTVIPSYAEGFGFTLLEAAACGSRIACSDIDVFKENAPGDTLLFDPFDITSITSSLNKLEKSGEGEVKNKSRFDIESYSWESYVKRIINIYNAMVVSDE